MNFGVVAIGRNEGVRLKRCLESLSSAATVVYVDSGSTDGSSQMARSSGVDVVDLDPRIPFTAARARNAGFKRMRERAPNVSFVQFLDGDCELIEDWPRQAISFLETHKDVGAICGRLRERHPEQSIYNWLCQREWDQPSGEVLAFGGIVMMRASTLEAVNGYREDLIAGEEPELSVRLVTAGWRIWRLDCEMATHDAGMTRFGQWWQRNKRSGYAFAQNAYLHGMEAKRHFVWASFRSWLWGVFLPAACVAAGLAFGFWGWTTFLIYPLHIAQKVVRSRGRLRHRVLLATFHVLGHFAESWGQIRFLRDRLLGRQAALIEYK